MATEFTDTQADRPALTLDGQMFEISKAVHFEAAHRLPGRKDDDPYGRLHGHSFRLEATVCGEVAPKERWVEDLAVLTVCLKRVASQLDHQLLNDIDGLDVPTLENIALWVANALRADLPALSSITLSRPSLNEHCTLHLKPKH